MLWIVLGVGVLALLVLPGWWVKRVLRRHAGERPDYPGTGGDMARHLLGKLGLDDVTVASSDAGDHYDPRSRSVRLTPDKLDGKSLTAVVVAAHEVGHAVQHARGEPLFHSRTLLAYLALWMQRLAPAALLITPLLVFFTPAASRFSLIIAVGAMLVGTLVHLATLPVEWDASFGKALPLLQDGGYLNEQDMQDARRILLAAALTYVAGSLFSLLNVWQWLRYLRR